MTDEAPTYDDIDLSSINEQAEAIAEASTEPKPEAPKAEAKSSKKEKKKGLPATSDIALSIVSRVAKAGRDWYLLTEGIWKPVAEKTVYNEFYLKGVDKDAVKRLMHGLETTSALAGVRNSPWLPYGRVTWEGYTWLNLYKPAHCGCMPLVHGKILDDGTWDGSHDMKLFQQMIKAMFGDFADYYFDIEKALYEKLTLVGTGNEDERNLPVVVIIGPKNNMKSLVVAAGLSSLTGKMVDATSYLTGEDKFNGSFASSPLATLDDLGNLTQSKRDYVKGKLKAHAAKPLHEVRTMYKESITERLGGLLVVLANENQADVAPSPTDDVADKFIVLHTAGNAWELMQDSLMSAWKRYGGSPYKWFQGFAEEHAAFLKAREFSHPDHRFWVKPVWDPKVLRLLDVRSDAQPVNEFLIQVVEKRGGINDLLPNEILQRGDEEGIYRDNNYVNSYRLGHLLKNLVDTKNPHVSMRKYGNAHRYTIQMEYAEPAPQPVAKKEDVA